MFWQGDDEAFKSAMMTRRITQLALGTLGLLLLLAFVQFLPTPDESYFWDRAYDTGHIFVFGVAVWIVLASSAKLLDGTSLRRQYLFSVTITILLGGVLEVWQESQGRSAEWIDFFNDVVGVLAFAALFASTDSRLVEPGEGLLRKVLLRTVGVAILLVGLACFLPTVLLYRSRVMILPQLVDFAPSWNKRLYYVQSGAIDAVPPRPAWAPTTANQRTVGRLRLEPGKNAGFYVHEPYPDWAPYRRLEIDAHLDTAPRDFVVRVHDKQTAGEWDSFFYKAIRLERGFQTISIDLEDIQSAPRHRVLDLRQIAGLALFTEQLDERLTLYIMDIRLVREP